MKKLWITALVVVIVFTSCGKRFEHDFYVSGTLLENCETKTPVGGLVLSYKMNGATFATATTDAYGYFEMKGTSKEKNGGHEDEAYLVISSYDQPGHTGGINSRKIARIPLEGAELDTIYEEMLYMVQVKIEPPTNRSIGDTLFLYFQSPSGSVDDLKSNSYGVGYKRKYAAPFGDIIDTIRIKGDHSPLYRVAGPPVIYYWTDHNSVGNEFLTTVKPEEQLNSSTMNLCKDVIPVSLTF